MKTLSLKSVATALSTLALGGAFAALGGCAVAADAPEPTLGTTAQALSVDGPTAMQRLERLGLTDVRGIAYHPGPAADANGQYGFSEGSHVLTPGSTERKYTIYNDADFASSDFSALWGKGADGRGRDDLRRFKEELNVNLVTLYDWNAGSDGIPHTRDHKPFFEYADSLGIKTTAAVSDWIRREQLCASDPNKQAEGYRAVGRLVEEIYPDGKPLPGLGLIKVFNEPDNQSACPQWASVVAETLATIQAKETALHVADADRVPMFVPVTFGIRDGIAGGALGEVHAKVVANKELGQTFWAKRMVIAVNPFNEGFFMKEWLQTSLPSFEAEHDIPQGTPVIFTEYGKSSQEVGNDVNRQAAWVDEQLQAVKTHPTSAFVGSVAFVNQVRPWMASPEPGYGLMEFGGDGHGWKLPASDYLAKVTYTNPNGGGSKWDGAYPVQRQTPRPAYWKVARAYAR